MAASDSADALAYTLVNYNQPGYITYEPSLLTVLKSRQKEINKMHCRATEEEMRSLQRCGCNQCYDKYQRLVHDIERERYRDYYAPIQMPALKLTDYSTTKETPKMETVAAPEPKNIAVKILVDKLKVKQISLNSNKATLDSYKAYVKQYNAKKLADEKDIRELSAALKKLGHKE